MLALALHEDNRNIQGVLCALAHYCKVIVDCRASARYRTRQKAMLMNLLVWHSQRAVPDGLFNDYEFTNLLLNSIFPDPTIEDQRERGGGTVVARAWPA